MQDMLLILNFDSRYASTVAIKLRAERIDCIILPGDTPFEKVVAQGAMGLVLAGGVTGEIPATLDGRLLSAGIPVLALGDPALGLVSLLGGSLGPSEPMVEPLTVQFHPSRVTEGIGESERLVPTLRSMVLSDDLQPLATAEEHVVGFMHSKLPILGFSFQLESNDPDGMSMLMRFAQDVCGCSAWLTDNAFINATRDKVAQVVGEGRALCAMTGGLDSGVAAMLAHRALGDRLQCIFIDTGLLRENEAEEFLGYYERTLGMQIMRINAQDRFLEALQGVTGHTDKAAIVASVYHQVLQETAAKVPHQALIRGTSANDVLNTGDGYSTPGIASEAPLVEPLRELFKEEIRHIGESLGMPQEIYQAQPFPGTGLALRVLGEATGERLEILRRVDAIFREEIREAGLQRRLWKYFAVLYHLSHEADSQALAVALRAVTVGSVSGETKVLPARLPYDLQERVTARILQEYPRLLRVVNDITPGASYAEIELR